MISYIVVAILGFAGGGVFGALVRQPEINKLKEQVRCLENELANMHSTVENYAIDIELVQLIQSIKDNPELVELADKKIYGSNSSDFGLLVYCYALKEYLELKTSFLLEKKDITNDEAVYIDCFALYQQNRVDKDKQSELMKFINEYILEKYDKEIKEGVFPDIRNIMNLVDEKLKEYQQAENDKKEKVKYNKVLSDLEKLFLIDGEQTRIMYSIKLRMIQYDIDNSTEKTEKEKQIKQHKITWRDQWKKYILDTVCEDKNRIYYFIKDDYILYETLNKCISKSENYNWLYLIGLECALFTPYKKFAKEDKNMWRGLKIKYNYLEDVFCKKQNIISSEDLKSFRITYKKNMNKIEKNTEKSIAAVTAIAVASIVSGGVAGFLAPEIAVAIVGNSLALSGAALTNASLAIIGGGSLAVGGLGMAGGTAIITGGGMLIGALSTGMTATAANLLSVSGLGIQSSASLLTFCDICLKKQDDFNIIANNILNALNENIKNCEKIADDIKNQEEKDKEDKKVLKNIKENIKYIKRCVSILKKEIDKFIKTHQDN